jgi:hypothetical protein
VRDGRIVPWHLSLQLTGFAAAAPGKSTANAGALPGRRPNTAKVPPIHKIVLPLALMLGACDSDEPDDAEEAELAAEASSERE